MLCSSTTLSPLLRKDVVLQTNSDVNVDETSECYRFIMVTRSLAGIIFFLRDCRNEDGSKYEGRCRRKVLIDFLGDIQLRSLQSDGYNIYVS